MWKEHFNKFFNWNILIIIWKKYTYVNKYRKGKCTNNLNKGKKDTEKKQEKKINLMLQPLSEACWHTWLDNMFI